MGMAQIETADTMLERFRETLLDTDLQVRLEFGVAYGNHGMLQTVQLYARKRVAEGNPSFKKVGPFLTTPTNTRAALLELLAGLVAE
jgi:hypothetical protein